MLNQEKIKKILNIVGNVVLYIFIFICLASVVITIASKKDSDGTATVFGMQMRIVISPSMEKCDATDVSKFEIKDIPTGSLVFVEVVPEDADKAEDWYDDIEVGDVLTFKYVYVRQETITHRVTKITETEGGYIIELEGDNKNDESGVLTQVIDTSDKNSTNYVIGKVVGQSYPLGMFLTALKSPAGLILIVILPSLIIMGYEIFKLIKLSGEDKRKKDEEEKAAQQSELDELRRRLAELETKKNEPATEADASNEEN